MPTKHIINLHNPKIVKYIYIYKHKIINIIILILEICYIRFKAVVRTKKLNINTALVFIVGSRQLFTSKT